MKILVTFAVQAEFAPWRRLRRFRAGLLEGVPVYGARLGASEVRVGLTGVGPGCATRALRALMGDRPDLCISSGLAGGLRPEHHAGDVLVARAVGLTGTAGLLRSDESLFQFAIGCGAKSVEFFQTAQALARTAREKSGLGLKADAVEMESYAVLSEAARHAVPAVAIRVVGDTSELNLPYDFDRALGERGQIRLPRLLAQVALGPHRLPALVRFGLQARRSAVALTEFLDLYVGAWEAGIGQSQISYELAAT